MSDEKLKAAARSAGMIDVNDLAMVDTAAVQDPNAFVAELKKAKPHLFKVQKHPRDMSDSEFKGALGAIKTAARRTLSLVKPPAKDVKDMTPEEYEREKQRLGVRHRSGRIL
jgi:hypothetical protein